MTDVEISSAGNISADLGQHYTCNQLWLPGTHKLHGYYYTTSDLEDWCNALLHQ